MIIRILYRRFGKRALDVVLSLVAMVVFSPLFLTLSLLVYLRVGTPIFFRQQRPGLRGKPFVMLKFRTMTDARDRNGSLLPDARRLTLVGRFMRSTSLDELPELLNVLQGDMSIVGPRPLLMHYLELYDPDQARRHEVKPGITGWAQVNGRNALSWEERFKLDVWYVDYYGLSLDIRIILMTFKKVLQREGISQEGHATMTEFMGGR